MSHAEAVALPLIRLVLLPGVRAVSREPGVLQVGLDAPRRVLVPDHPDVRRLLDALATGTPTRACSPEAVIALRDLERAGLVLSTADADDPGPLPRMSRAALARHGADAPARLDARAEARALLDVPPDLRPEAARLARLAGLTAVESLDEASVVLMLVDGEFHRSRLDRWVRESVPHLCVQAHDGVLSVGPYVVPGVTACRRCVDAHLGESDPRRPVIVEQLASASSREPVDDLLRILALTWAVQDLASAAEGVRPSSWSATIDLGPELTTTRRTWARHPHCGCAWDHWPAPT